MPITVTQPYPKPKPTTTVSVVIKTDGPATQRQLDFIHEIASFTRLLVPDQLTKKQASQWIKRHLPDYNDAIDSYCLGEIF